MPEPRIHAGTSGYSYPGWKGGFYPEKLAQSKFLEFYSQKLSTVEINNTFYQFPTAKLLDGWREATPAEFSFAVKANQRITHHSRLKDVAGVTHDFIDRCRLLQAKLGSILFQLPPFLRRDDELLKEFTGALLPGTRYAIEFRHASWFDEAVHEVLRAAGVALCVSEGEELDTPKVVTAGFTYVRLRKDEYSEAELAAWKRWFHEQVKGGRDVFAYLKHDEKGVSPERALGLLGA
jgi:uncharacterized protein YecE (DUF72 family)